MAASSRTVTIGKDYFDVLLRRAQVNETGSTSPTTQDVAVVTILSTEHDKLVEQSRRLDNLQRNLFRGGVTVETLDILTNDDTGAPQEEDVPEPSPVGRQFGDIVENQVLNTQRHQPNYPTSGANGTHHYTNGNGNYGGQHRGQFQQQYNGFQNHQHGYDAYDFTPDEEEEEGFFDGGNGNGDGYDNSQDQPVYQKPRFQKDAKRSIFLANLAEGTTHADVIDNVRGGMLLDIYFRNDRCCIISFLDEDDARAFYGFAKRHDLYIRDKRIEVRWNDRQFTLHGHVANKISIGATRNLIIRNAYAKHTEESIRDHAEHIHNLVVIKVVFQGRDISVQCNSVHNAMFLKTCLMSRATYKGCKIEWDVDECAAPLSVPVRPAKKETIKPKQSNAALNRFEALNVDGTENGSEDDEDEDGHDTSFGTLRTHFTTTTGITAG